MKIFEERPPTGEHGGGGQELFAVGFTRWLLNHHIYTTVSYGLSEDEKFEISDETTYEIVHQFMYGIYS